MKALVRRMACFRADQRIARKGAHNLAEGE